MMNDLSSALLSRLGQTRTAVTTLSELHPEPLDDKPLVAGAGIAPVAPFGQGYEPCEPRLLYIPAVGVAGIEPATSSSQN